MLIQKFRNEFRDECLDIFDSNRDPYFAEDERMMFADFLENPLEIEHYYVVTYDNSVVACGGFLSLDPNVVELNWGMVRRDYHRRGLGTLLLEFRLNRISEIHLYSKVIVNTSQFSEGFYSRLGFEPVKAKPDGFGPGLNQITMELPVRE